MNKEEKILKLQNKIEYNTNLALEHIKKAIDQTDDLMRLGYKNDEVIHISNELVTISLKLKELLDI